MFDLEEAIKAWKRDLAKNPTLEETYVAELEAALRDEVADRIRRGESPEEAFRRARSGMGEPKAIGAEFAKVRSPRRFGGALLGNYVRIALRRMLRQKGYSFLTVAGLALGMACAILIVLFIHHELSFDRFHENSDRISRVVVDATDGHQQILIPSAQMAFGPTLAEKYPDVAAFARVQRLSKTLVKYADRGFYETGLLYADASVFDVFTFPLAAGDPRTALAQARTVVLTEKTAKKYFGGEDPLGKTLRFDDKEDFVVTGVMRDVPGNSHLQFDGLVSLETRFASDAELRQDWLNVNVPTYVLFRDKRGPKEIEPKLAALVEEKLGPLFKRMSGARIAYSFQPLAKIHLFSRFAIDFVATAGSIQYVYVFAAIALFILAIACINFMNLATARSAKRAREIGLRKAVGAGRPALFAQFLGEATIHSLFSLAAALALVWLVLPLFRSISGIDFKLGTSQLAWLAPSLLGLVLFVGLAAGSYPAFFLSALHPVSTLKGTWRAAPGGARFRHVLVVVQFLIGVTLIIGTMVVRRQLDFMRTRDLGFSPTKVLVAQVDNATVFPRIESIKASLKEIPGVVSAALTQAVPGQDRSTNASPYVPEGIPESQPEIFRQFYVDADLVPTLGMEVVRGRNFSRTSGTDEDALLINEAMARRLGWADPVGRKIKVPASLGKVPSSGGPIDLGWREKTVIGVVRDFHFLGLRQPIEPYLLEMGTRMGQLIIKLKTERLGATIRDLQQAWKEIDPVRPFDFFFLDTFFNAQYQSDERLGRLVTASSGLAIVIACLGLFGLASFLAEQRAKEIAIRRVLGASVRGILARQSVEFLKLVAISIVLAWPVAYFAMVSWQRNFAYRAHLSPWTFIAAGAMALTIAFLTVAGQAYRAAASSPVKSINYE